MELRNYQKRICNFIVDHPHVCVSVGMGLGKTACVLHVLDHIKTRCPEMTALIVAPKRVAETVWMQEAEKWGFDVRKQRNIVKEAVVEAFGEPAVSGRRKYYNITDLMGVGVDPIVFVTEEQEDNINDLPY